MLTRQSYMPHTPTGCSALLTLMTLRFCRQVSYLADIMRDPSSSARCSVIASVGFPALAIFARQPVPPFVAIQQQGRTVFSSRDRPPQETYVSSLTPCSQSRWSIHALRIDSWQGRAAADAVRAAGQRRLCRHTGLSPDRQDGRAHLPGLCRRLVQLH